MMRRQQGIALLEALIASIILAIGLIGAIGMQARAVSALSDAGLRAEATLAADRLAGLINTDLANVGAYAVALGATPPAALAAWHAETRAAIPGAAITVTVTNVAGAGARVDLNIGWQRKAGDKSNTYQVSFYPG